MKKKVLARRYGQGLVNTLRDDSDFRAVSGELAEAAAIFFGPGEMRSFLASPFVAKNKKSAAVAAVLERTGADRRVENFLKLLQEKGRFELLPGILELLPLLWNERTGVVSMEVASAVPLGEDQRERLRAAVESREGRPVALSFRLEPALLGGLTLRKGNEVIDLSVGGRLARLRDILAGN